MKHTVFNAPTQGICIPIEEVNDPVFSQKMMGEGFAIIPSGNCVVSPVDGEIVMVFPTHHALGIQDNQGNEIMLHLGLHSFDLKGKGLQSSVTVGQKVHAGDSLIAYDLKVFQKENIDPTLVIVFLNGQKVTLTTPNQMVEQGQIVDVVIHNE